MFDIGFSELMVVVVIGLLVIGPERLPGTIRTVSLWVGRLRRSLRDTRAELEEHIGADEIRRQLHNEEVMRSLEHTRSEINRTLNEHIALGDEPQASQPDTSAAGDNGAGSPTAEHTAGAEPQAAPPPSASKPPVEKH